MFIVIELQTSGNTTALLTDTYEDLEHAYQKFYTILATAAVSEVPIHTALIVDAMGCTVAKQTFKRD